MGASRILTLNIGASHVTLAEFKVARGAKPVLLQYGSMPLGVEPDSDADPAAFVIDALRSLTKSLSIRPSTLLMAVSGQTVFPRFIKLPPVQASKLLQMVRYEAEQSVPFPIDEVVWDYQLIGDSDGGEQNAMIVAMKTESASSLTDCVQAIGMEPAVVDVAPLAIANCVQASYGQVEGCTLVIDIGARSTNLVFLEDGRVFYRTISIAGNAITNEIAKAFEIDFRAAENLKRESAFVALGGTYASGDENADKLSKVVRNVVTRLHAEINRSINFYRSQQGGAVPVRVLLAGGSCVIPHLGTFFREKMKVEVEFLNPFDAVTLGGRLDPDAVSSDFPSLCEVVGLAVRSAQDGVARINLMPPALIQRKTLRRSIPFLAAGAICIIAASALIGYSNDGLAAVFSAQKDKAQSARNSHEKARKEIRAELAAADDVVKDIETYNGLVRTRTAFLHRIDAVRSAMLEGSWINSIDTVKEDGVPVRFAIVCRGFADMLRKAEDIDVEAAKKDDRAPRTAPEIFCDRLAALPPFSGQPRITLLKDVDGLDGGRIREFRVEVDFNKDFTDGKEGE